MTDLISRADAIEAVYQLIWDEPPYCDSEALCRNIAKEIVGKIPSAEAEPTVIRSKTLLPTKDFKEWAKRIREVNRNAVVIPCDAEVASSDAVQGEWDESVDVVEMDFSLTDEIRIPITLTRKSKKILGKILMMPKYVITEWCFPRKKKRGTMRRNRRKGGDTE